jgi:hypothetical protein
MRFSVTQMLIGVGCFGLVLGAFTRGNYLMGISAGIAFVSLALATIFVLIRVVPTKRRFNGSRVVLASIFALFVVAFLTMPAQFSVHFHHVSNRHQIERTTWSQLNSILSNDPRFAKLKFDFSRAKGFFVTVEGSIQSENDLLELRNQILERCPHISRRFLFWRLNIVETGVMHDASDLKFFSETEVDAESAG